MWKAFREVLAVFFRLKLLCHLLIIDPSIFVYLVPQRNDSRRSAGEIF